MLLDVLLKVTGGGAGGRPPGWLRRARRRGRRVTAVLAGVAAAAGSVVPVPAAVTGVVAAGVVAAGVVAASAVVAGPAKASGLPVLVVLAGGESAAPEAALLTSAGYSVTQVTPPALESMTQSAFQGYAAVVIGDPSSGGSCPAS